MHTPQPVSQKTFLSVLVILGWFALAGQLYLVIENRTDTVPEVIIRYFSYFTILTNLLAALYTTFNLFKKPGNNNGFFAKQTTATAITVYITVVGITYNLILRFIWAPEGLQRIVDELLHAIIPALFIIYWFIYVRKDELQWKHLFPFLPFPLCYIIIILIRGAFSSFYPYPFVDVNILGYTKVLINSAILTVVFVLFSLLYIWIGRSMAKRASSVISGE